MISKALFSSASVEWATPQDLFYELDAEFQFTLDPCATAKNAKCAKFYTKATDGLSQDWSGERVFCNPPYGRGVIGPWVQKCHDAAALVVALLPARTDTRWFHEHVAYLLRGNSFFGEVRFVRGRLKFGGHKNSAPFPSMVVVWNRRII